MKELYKEEFGEDPEKTTKEGVLKEYMMSMYFLDDEKFTEIKRRPAVKSAGGGKKRKSSKKKKSHKKSKKRRGSKRKSTKRRSKRR
jgi:hypothetical protein